MFINKMGQYHLENGTNCQDYGFDLGNRKLVCDGCSEGMHSEVGAKTFSHLVGNGFDITEAFQKMIDVYGQTAATIKNYLCFTIMSVEEYEDRFAVKSCGDGYIILQDNSGNITFQKLDDGEYPKYYAYNYCDPNTLKHYKDGVELEHREYLKADYMKVGVASDGVRYILSDDNEIKEEFMILLQKNNPVKIKRFINRNQKKFKDDITISF